jgi:hypothetical protein
MSVINSQPLIGASGNQGGAYNLTRSLRFRSSASAYLSRTPASAGNRTVWTWSGWVKRGQLGTYQALFDVYIDTNNASVIDFTDSNNLRLNNLVGGVAVTNKITSAVYRDTSAWYHIVVSSNGATSLNLYVNGVQVTAWGTNTGPDASNWLFNSTNAHWIGREQYSTTNYYTDGYLAEVNFIDGQALTPSSFGETDAATGVWIPKAYTGSFGTNGFYLDFEDTSSVAALGYDAAGSNDWTVNNVSLTSGTTYDSMTDVPTLTSATAANYAVMNPLPNTNGNAVLTNGNLAYSGTQGTTYALTGSTIGMSSGKFYWEVTIGTVTPSLGIGVFRLSNSTNYSTFTSGTDGGIAFFSGTANTIYYWNGSSQVSTSYTLPACTTGDVVSIALDLTNGGIYFAKNGTWGASGDPATQTNPALTGLSGTYAAGISIGAAGTSLATLNFGQQPFAYTPPSGFVALNTFNLPTPTIGATASTQANKYMDATLYTGNGSTQTITNAGGFEPDLVWIKMRSGTDWHLLQDSVRGAGKSLNTNVTNAESGNTGDLISSFNANGFTVNNTYLGGANTTTNGNGSTFVGWQWRASDSSAVSNTSGTITSTVSANTSAGFSVVTYTGTGSAATIGHGLGVAPSMVIVKNRDAADAWQVYHAANTAAPETDYLVLNTTAATADAADRWNDTLPTSTVFSIGNGVEVNTNTEKYVAYCFAEVAGYSKFGSYTGNGSTDGPFVYLGFRPKFILWKNASSGAVNWLIEDSTRSTYNVMGAFLFSNTADAEDTNAAFDFLSNGFKVRDNGATYNGSTNTIIYAAFAENPFKYANAR